MHACLHSVLTEQNLVLGSVLSMYGTPDFQSIIMCQNILLGFIYHCDNIKVFNQGKSNQIREKSGNLIAKNVWPPCIQWVNEYTHFEMKENYYTWSPFLSKPM